MCDKTKRKVNEPVPILIEKAARLKVVTGFEKSLLRDRMVAVDEYSMKAVMTVGQLEVISDMASRYDALRYNGFLRED